MLASVGIERAGRPYSVCLDPKVGLGMEPRQLIGKVCDDGNPKRIMERITHQSRFR